MAVCRDCDQEMLAGAGCTAFPGRRPVEGEKCHDCSAPVGAMHHPGCDMERCDHGGQAIICDECNDVKAATGLDYWQRVSAAVGQAAAWAVQKSLDGTVLRRFSGRPFDDGGRVSGQGVMPSGSSAAVWQFTEDQRAALRRMGADGALRSAAFSDAALSAREVIEQEATRQVLADAAVREEVLRARMGAAIAAGLKEQASRHPGFQFESTSDRDMFLVSGVLTVSELAESVVKVLSDG